MWNPRYGKHISQLHPETGSGADDCGPACVTRYLFEVGKLDPALDPFAALAQVAEVIRGIPDSDLNNPTTDGNQLIAGLAHYGITGCSWTSSYQAALNAPWSIPLVDGTELVPRLYPQSWFPNPGMANHWCLWLPNWKGSPYWLNNPLAYTNGQQDNVCASESLAAAFYGAILLPSTNAGETGPVMAHVVQKCSLKPRTDHTSNGIGQIPAGAQVQEIGAPVKTGKASSEQWQKVQWHGPSGDKIGFVLASNIKAA